MISVLRPETLISIIHLYIKLEKMMIYFKEDIKQAFTNQELYQLFIKLLSCFISSEKKIIVSKFSDDFPMINFSSTFL